eukprot:10668657-Heterocapsa_arctica.AAC.1
MKEITAIPSGELKLEQKEMNDRPWMLFEWCCEPDSRLSAWFEQHGHGAIRLGLPEHDLRQASVVDAVVDTIIDSCGCGFAVILWIALTCTSWCTWQRINFKLSEDAWQR